MSDSSLGQSPKRKSACCAPSCCGGDVAAPSDDLREAVRQRYGQAVQAVLSGSSSACCGSSATTLGNTDPITRDLYATEETAGLPEEAVRASFGCGNPTALAELRPGETVLDLGSGGGIDVLLSAKRVGPTGRAYGLDMTDEMLDLARQNRAKAGVTNAEFLRGTIEAIPLPAASVDVIISNCVINLSTDKDSVLREAFRVLRPGGRFAVSDIVIRRELPEAVRKSLSLWTGCVAGALLESEYVEKLAHAGFTEIEVEPTRVYSRDDALEMASSCSCSGDLTSLVSELDGAVMSAFVRARKP
jgi:arsenite methyltransferase